MACSSLPKNNLSRPDAGTLQLGDFLSPVQALQTDERALELRCLALTLGRQHKQLGYKVCSFSGREPCPGCIAPCQNCPDCLLCR
jgi:hypothetical protein